MNSIAVETIATYLSVIIDSCIDVSCRLSVGVQMAGLATVHWFALSANNKSISLAAQNVGNMLHTVRRKGAFSAGYDCSKPRKQNVDFSEKILKLLTELHAKRVFPSQTKITKEVQLVMQKDIKVSDWRRKHMRCVHL
jgi:hypothetical protein